MVRDCPISPAERLEEELRKAEQEGAEFLEFSEYMTFRDVRIAVDDFNENRSVSELNALVEGPRKDGTWRIRLTPFIP